MSWWGGAVRLGRAYRLDMIWVAFVGINLAAMRLLPAWGTVPFLAIVPLIALMFLVMVWHGRRRIAAMEEQLTAMEEVQRISQENLRLLKEQHRFLQDASHELGTPITVALGTPS